MLAQSKQGGRYTFGDVITAADVVFYPQIFNTKNRFKIDLTPFPLISQTFDNLSKVKDIIDA